MHLRVLFFITAFCFSQQLSCLRAAAQVKYLIDDFEDYHQEKAPLNTKGLFQYGSLAALAATNPNSSAGMAGQQVLKVMRSGTETFGGWGKGLGANLDLNPEEDYFNLLLYRPGANRTGKLKLILQEDDNQNGVFDQHRDDAWVYEPAVVPATQWQLLSVPLSAFKDENAGGDGLFQLQATKSKLTAIIVSFPDLAADTSASTWYFDLMSFSKGKLLSVPSAEAPAAGQHTPAIAPTKMIARRSRKTIREWQHMGDAVRSNKWLLGQNVFSATLGYSMGRHVNQYQRISPVATEPPSGSNRTSVAGLPPAPVTSTHYAYEFRNELVFAPKIRFFEDVYLNITFFKNLNPATIKPWTADYYYSFGRFNWRPRTFSYGYENFVSNKYTDDAQTFKKKYLQGYYFISYGHDLPEKLQKPFKIDRTSNIRITYFTRYGLRYQDRVGQVQGNFFSGKTTLGVSARYTIAKNLYVESAVFQYLKPKSRKMPWDPDFSYGFGYFNYRSFRASVIYSNWVNNRFPWNPKEVEKYGILDGDLRVMLNFNW